MYVNGTKNVFSRSRINMTLSGGKRGDRSIVHYTMEAKEMMVKIWKYEPIANTEMTKFLKNGWIKKIIGWDRAFAVFKFNT